VVYTADKKKLVRYPSGKECVIFRVPDEVEQIGDYAFADAEKLSGVLIGKNCRSICENAFVETTACSYASDNHVEKYLGIRKYYISPAVEDIGAQIFDGDWEEDGLYYNDIIVGGATGSAIWEHCNKCNIPFLEVREEEAEAFLATPYETLVERHKKASEAPISFEFSDEGFGGRLDGETLSIFSLDSARKGVTICSLDPKLPKNRYEKIKKLIIGDGICSIAKNAFWEYYGLESITFGRDISDINAGAFYSDYSISELVVDGRNEHYKCIDGVVFSSDLRTLVLYPSGREAFYYEIPSHVEVVGPASMMSSKLKCIRFGNNVRKICKEACYNTYAQHHFYVAPSVSEFGDDFIFGVDGKMNVMCTCTWRLVVGGKAGSPIEKYCRETGRDGITFEVVEDDKIDEWLAPQAEDGLGMMPEVGNADDFHF